jgi:hypothetical protein
MKTKRINVRLPLDLYNDLKKKNGTITHNVCLALQMYLSNDTSRDQADRIREDYVKYLRDENLFLRNTYKRLVGTPMRRKRSA